AGGVFLSVLGFGNGNLQDYKMEQIANKGNGNYNYIDNILEAKKVLVNEMGGTLFTIAKDVKVQAEFNPAKVKAYRLIGYVNRVLEAEDFNDDKKDAGELGAGHTVTVLYEIIPAGSEEKITEIDKLKYQKEKVLESLSDELLTVKFRYKEPEGKKSILITKIMKDETVEFQESSHNLQFSAAVASFGMKLRKSESVKNMEYKDIKEIAKMAKGVDENGYRAEFLKLVQTAELIK
ncbi:MAG: Ca-activated chloride channel family protein, partial [Vicingaceae bacterium]